MGDIVKATVRVDTISKGELIAAINSSVAISSSFRGGILGSSRSDLDSVASHESNEENSNSGDCRRGSPVVLVDVHYGARDAYEIGAVVVEIEGSGSGLSQVRCVYMCMYLYGCVYVCVCVFVFMCVCV